jgi:hypothetical protein
MTALSLTLCVLLVALWMRSYWWVDALPVAPSRIVGSMRGNFCIDCDYSFSLDITPSSHQIGPFITHPTQLCGRADDGGNEPLQTLGNALR